MWNIKLEKIKGKKSKINVNSLKNKSFTEIRKHMSEFISGITSVRFPLIIVFSALFNPVKMNQPMGHLPNPPGASAVL